MGADYYRLLGISKDATDDDVKRGYKKMALKWHPDRNNGSEEANKKFKEISEAFEVLSDSNKRAVYDQFGEEGLKRSGPSPTQGAPGGGFSGFSGFPGGGGTTFTFTNTSPGGFGSSPGFAPSDPNKIFEQIFGGGLGGLFGGMSGAAGMGGMPSGMGGMGGRPGMGSTGKRRTMFDMDVDDNDMGGGHFGFGGGGMPGGMPGGAHSRAPPQRSQTSPSPPSEIVRPLKLSINELYTGTTKHIKVGRRLLDGTVENKVLDINIAPGFKPGTKIRFPRAGNEQSSGEAQDIVFVVEEKPHDFFTREGNDLSCKVKISLLEALAGPPGGGRLIKTVEHLDGRKLQIQVPPPVVDPGQTTTVSGEGMPIRKEGIVQKKGDLIVKWDVVFPNRLTPSQQEGIRKVLG